VYAATRKSAESLAEHLQGHYRVVLYHAGLSQGHREQTQSDFLRGEADVMVATVAFGMGVDKSNVRTVIHSALPSSLEAYYQEIGRAGRDAQASKAYLMWSYADRKMQEFLFERNYPDLAVLERLIKCVQKNGEIARDVLQTEFPELSPEIFESCLEKLWVHGGLWVDSEDTIRIKDLDQWKQSYKRQFKHRLEQMNLVAAFAKGHACRMLHLVRHFGDKHDSGKACAICDVCHPNEAAFRKPTESEASEIFAVFNLVCAREGQSLSRIHREGADRLERRIFESYLMALARAGCVEIEERCFEKDARSIAYRTAHPMVERQQLSELWSKLVLAIDAPRATSNTKKIKTPRTLASRTVPNDAATPLVVALKKWRLDEARSRQTPAFTILPDRTLYEIALQKPRCAVELLGVRGMGPKLVDKHGEAILAILSAC
jgi:superfamily II DNA helicase RecQ